MYTEIHVDIFYLSQDTVILIKVVLQVKMQKSYQ